MISRIGKYTVEAELGRGGFGQVYKAWDPDVRQSVAIKVLLAEGDPDLLRRFQMEVVTTASLHHKNIVAIYASGEEGGTPYLVMELLEGQTLAQLIRNQTPLSVMEKVRIMTQVAEGLAFANSKGIVHRDVKPANIMLLPDGQVKIMDFGIALASNRVTATVTMDGFVVGTVPYMAPEQFNAGGKANELTDIFAFGDVYYELLTGKHPFEPYLRDLSGLRLAILNHDPAPLSQVVEGCPESLELLVLRTLAKEREFRYQTFEEVRLDSAAILGDLQHDQAAAILRDVPRMLAAGEVSQARARVREAQRLEPGNREARQLLEAIDQKLQEKMSRERIAARVTEAEKQIAERHFAEAVQSLEMAARVDTTNVAVRVRLADAKALLDSALQANRLVEEARVRQQKGELAEAADRLNRALQIDAQHTEAARLLPRVNEQLARRQRDQTRQHAMRVASEHLAARQYNAALAVLNELEAQQAGGAGVAEMRSRIELERVEEERRVRAERFHLALSRTRETMQAGDLERAGRMLAHLDANFSMEPGAAEVLPLLHERLDALLRRSNTAVRQPTSSLPLPETAETESFRGAATAPAPRQSATNEWLDSGERPADLAPVRKRAESLRAKGDLRGALAAIAEGRRRLGDPAALAAMAREIEAEIERKRYAAGLHDLLDAVKELMASGLYADAIVRLTRSKEYAGEAEVLALLDSARMGAGAEEQQKFVAGTLAAASRLRAEGDWQRAVGVLENGLAKYPHNQVLTQTLERMRNELARERRSLAIEAHRSAILLEMEEGAWHNAEAAVRRAQLEFPDESMFDDLAEQVEAGMREQILHEAVSRVKETLAAGNPPEAIQQSETRPVFARDPRWKALEEEVSRRRAHQEGKTAETETVAQPAAGAPDLRATETLDMVRGQKSGVAADEAGWSQLQEDFDALEARLRRQAAMVAEGESYRLPEVAAIAQSVRACLSRGDLQQANAELAAARVKYPDEGQWATLKTEIDARQAQLTRQAHISAIADRVGERIKRDALHEAAAELKAARTKYPNEALWATLEQQIAQRQAFLDRRTQVAATAMMVRERLKRDDVKLAVAELDAARARYPDEALWSVLQSEIDAHRATRDSVDR